MAKYKRPKCSPGGNWVSGHICRIKIKQKCQKHDFGNVESAKLPQVVHTISVIILSMKTTENCGER